MWKWTSCNIYHFANHQVTLTNLADQAGIFFLLHHVIYNTSKTSSLVQEYLDRRYWFFSFLIKLTTLQTQSIPLSKALETETLCLSFTSIYWAPTTWQEILLSVEETKRKKKWLLSPSLMMSNRQTNII